MFLEENEGEDSKMMSLDRERILVKMREYFENAGATVERREEFLERYGLDFTVTNFEDVHAHVNLGVCISTEQDDLDKLERFSKASRRGVVLKSIYIELPPETLDAGGLLVAYGACLSYLFDKRHEQVKSIGIRIFEDCTFHHFDVSENISRLQRMADDADMSIGESLSGRIIAYFTDKGFGFIQNDEDRKYFFHIANIVDDELRSRLPSYVPGEVIPVEFQYGGNDGKKYPKAINVAHPGYEE